MAKETKFTGFTPDASAFLWDLAFHNERPWFNENKQRFLTAVKEPFDALARETLSLLQAPRPDTPVQVHVSRIYRDARRLFGRGPYKDHLWMSFWTGVEKRDNPAFWFEISPSGYEYGVGFFQALPSEMEAYRRCIRENPEKMTALVCRLEKAERYRLIGPDYKRPKGDVGELLNPWYNKRWVGIDAAFDFEGDIFSPRLPEILAEQYEFLMPFYEFFLRFRDTGSEDRRDI